MIECRAAARRVAGRQYYSNLTGEMFAFYILAAGLILALPAVACIIAFWGTPMLPPVVAGFGFAYTPFIAAALLHRPIREMMAGGDH